MAPATMPNAEWAGWVQDAADHAASNGSRSCDTYRRAAKAIRAHNEPFHHPKQALVLSGVGEGVVRLITTRLQEKCTSTGDPFPSEPPKLKRKRPASDQKGRRKRPEDMLTAEERALDACSSDDQNEPSPKASNTNKSSTSQKKNPKPRRRRKSDALTAAERALDNPSSDSELPNTTKTQSKSCATRNKYIPKKRTGCWGMLVAMSVLTTEGVGPFTKTEIIQLAQEYCDSSYTETASRGGGAGNSGHYTAWNMKKLLTEGLTVSKPGRPTKFTLTQQGFEVGSVLADQEKLHLVPFDKSKLPLAAEEGAFIDSNPNPDELDLPGGSLPIASSSKDTLTSKKKKNRINSEIACPIPNSSQSGSQLPRNRGLFEFWYLDRGGLRVKNMDDADTRMHPRTFETLYQVEFAESQSSHPVTRSSIADEAPLCPTAMKNPDSHMIGWMFESKAIPHCPGFALSGQLPTSSASAIPQSSSLITSRNKNTSPKPPSRHLPSKPPRPSSPSRRPSVNIIQEESHCELFTQTTIGAGYQDTISPPGQFFKTGSSGSTTAAGSIISIHSDAGSIHEDPPDPLPIDLLKPPSRLGSCENMPSGSALSQTVVGWSDTNSPDSLAVSEHVNSRPSSCSLGTNLRQSSSMPSTRQSNPTSAAGLHSTQTSVNLQRSSSTLGLPSSRTLVSLKRTSSSLSESHFRRTPASLDFEPEVWKAGSYDICLVLDHREVRAVNDRDAFYKLCASKAAALSESHTSPTRVLQRALVLGDAIWIAIHRDAQREVVLDSIVERKRLDDLCASIKDKRFEEQKGRLKRSGLRDPIYLVEAYNTQSNHETNGQMIYTSKFETMLLNDFQLEATPDWKASVEFLMRRTEVLRDLHMTIDLSIIPDSEIDRTTYLPRLNDLRRAQPGRYWVTEYSSFEDLNHKSSTLTVRELWARMVHCLPGMSEAKVTSFVDHWPSPGHFWADINTHISLDPSASSRPSSDKFPWSWIERTANSPLPSSNPSPDDPAMPSTQSSHSNDSATGNTSNTTSARIGPSLSKKLWELYTLSNYDSSS